MMQNKQLVELKRKNYNKAISQKQKSIQKGEMWTEGKGRNHYRTFRTSVGCRKSHAGTDC